MKMGVNFFVFDGELNHVLVDVLAKVGLPIGDQYSRLFELMLLHELIELYFVVSALPCHFGVAMVLQSLVFLVPIGFDHFVLVESI